jgi:hypothetical protein
MKIRTEGRTPATLKSLDFFRFYKKNYKNPVKILNDYNRVREDIHKELSLLIYKGKQITFPHRFGSMRIAKRERKIVYNKDGTINKLNYKVDWGQTKAYWRNEKYKGLTDEEILAIKGKPKIYCKSKFRYRFKYDKTKAVYINKSLIYFIGSRDLCRNFKTFCDLNLNKYDYFE